MAADSGVEELPVPMDRARIDGGRPDVAPVIDEEGDVVSPPPPDAQDLDGSRLDASADARGTDASPDASVIAMDAAVDASARLDVPDIEVALPPQPCVWVAPPVAFGSNGRERRPVFVSSDMTGFAAGASVLREGADNVWIQRVARDGSSTIVGNVTGAPAGSMVRGGAFAAEAMFLVPLWSQSAAGGSQVFFQRLLGNYMPVPGSRVQVTASGTHEDPQVRELRRGSMFAWRTVVAGRAALSTAQLNLGAVGTTRVVTAPTADISSFRLVTSQPADLYALVFRDAGAIRVQRLAEDGSPLGTPLDVATGADLGDTVDAVIEDDGDLWVTWAQPAVGGTIRLRRISFGADGDGGTGPGPEINLAPTTGGSQPGISVDGADLAVGFRNLGESPSTMGLLRIRSADGSIRDQAQLGFAGPGGRVGIEARDGRYGIGWTDDLPSGSVTRLGVAICR